jgi:RHS repeat-associated protein
MSNARTQASQASQTVIWRWDLLANTASGSNAFGAQAANEDPNGNSIAVKFDLRFPGQQYDSEIGLNYNYFRDYEPGTGRYVESDPIGLQGGMSTYLYSDTNPLASFDPKGLMVCEKSPECPYLGGRYDHCCNLWKADSWGWVNDIRTYFCRKTADESCKKFPKICCEADFRQCAKLANGEPGDLAAYPECSARYHACILKGGQG